MERLQIASSAADLPAMTEDESRGAAIKRRFDALGYSDRRWKDETGIDIKTVKRAIDEDPKTRPGSYDAIETALQRLEDKMTGRPTVASPPVADPEEGLIEFRISGNFGVSAVVKGPMNNRAEVEASALRLLREIKAEKAAE